MKGFLGIPLSFSNCTKELNAVPEGSTPNRFHKFSPSNLYASVNEKTFEIL